MKKNKYNFIFLISRFFVICILCISFFSVTQAAVFSSTTDINTLGVGQNIKVSFFINTDQEIINTISGSVIYDSAVLEVLDVYTGNSLVPFWVTPPHNTDKQIISFEGIIPGGLVIDQGYLFSVVFNAKDIGKTSIGVSDVNVFLHDGLGTLTQSRSISTEITVTPVLSIDQSFSTAQDRQPPEKFSIIRTSTKSIFDGKWFISFAAQDKGVGVKKYLVCELLVKRCIESTVPYKLSNQSPWYVILVQAIDYHNNIRTAYLVSPLVVGAFTTAVLLCILYGVYVYISKKKRKK